jgi:hypothetical protein
LQVDIIRKIPERLPARMRLLSASSLEIEEFMGHDVPQYAILSHTWGEEEVTFQDMQGPKHLEGKGVPR